MTHYRELFFRLGSTTLGLRPQDPTPHKTNIHLPRHRSQSVHNNNKHGCTTEKLRKMHIMNSTSGHLVGGDQSLLISDSQKQSTTHSTNTNCGTYSPTTNTVSAEQTQERCLPLLLPLGLIGREVGCPGPNVSALSDHGFHLPPHLVVGTLLG